MKRTEDEMADRSERRPLDRYRKMANLNQKTLITFINQHKSGYKTTQNTA